MTEAAVDTTVAPRSHWLSPWAVAATIIGAVVVEYILYRYNLGYHNQTLQLPLLYWLQDPTLYPGDPLVASMGNYLTYFWPAMAWLTERLPLEPTFFAVHLLTNALKFAGLFALARGVSDDPRLPAASIWLLCFLETPLGHESLHWFYVAHTPFATAVGFWAMAAAVRGRWAIAYALAGLVFDIHAIQAAYLLVMFAIPYLLEWRRAPIAGKLAPLWFFPIALPMIVWTLNSDAAGTHPDMERLLRNFFPWHFFPDVIDKHAFYNAGAWVAAGAAGWWVTGKLQPAGRALGMVAGIVAFWVVGGIWIQEAPNGLLMKLHLFRSSSYLLVLSVMLALAGILSRGLPRMDPSARAMALLGLMLAIAFRALTRSWDYQTFPFLVERSHLMLVLLALALVGHVVGGVDKATARAAAAAMILIAAPWLVVLAVRRNFDTNLYYSWNTPYQEAQRWARENTPRDALFLTHPDGFGFRTFSQRPIVGEWFDGAGVLWSAEYAEYWKDWFVRVGGELKKNPKKQLHERLSRQWLEKPHAEVEAIAVHYGADYVLFRKPLEHEREQGLHIDWRGRLLWENNDFAIFEMPEDLRAEAARNKAARLAAMGSALR